MTVTKPFHPDHPLIGTWCSTDVFESYVEYTVSWNGESVAVAAVDTEDREAGEIYDVRWDGDVLYFAVHWTSTGRFKKCQFVLTSPDTVSLTYTYTAQEVLKRKI